MNARDTSYTDTLREALKNPEEAAAFIDAAIEQGDSAALLVALRHVAAAHGMAEITRAAGMGEKTLFQTLSDKGNPTLQTLVRVLAAMGLRLSVAPAEAQHASA
ncbi:putative addiction module antidote protein [Melaminivora sp.]